MYSLSQIIIDPICHFLLSGVVCVLAYLAIMAIFKKYCFPRMKAEEIVRVQLLVLFFCLGLAVIAHVVEDYTIDWF
jgi:uncharacterized metal-binding protein